MTLTPWLELNQIALRHLKVWALKGHTNPDAAELQCMTLEFELRNLGYRFKNPAFFGGITSDEYGALTSTLADMKGANVKYVPLFVNFPDELPNDHEYLIRRAFGAFGFGTFFFDKLIGTKFGADPITQLQNESLYNQAIAATEARLGDTHGEWCDLELVTVPDMKAKLERWAFNLFYSATPVKETLWADLLKVKSALALHVDLARVQVKETLARLAADAWTGLMQIRVKTPTDLLRMFAFLHEQDVSLATPVKFPPLRLSKPQRRAIAAFLEQCPALEEDLLRYRSLWLAFLKGIHPGSFKRQDRQTPRFPRLVQAHHNLRHNIIRSFESKLLHAGSEQLQVALERPGVFLRRITHLIQLRGDTAVASALMTLESRVKSLPLPLLMQAYFAVQYRGKGEKLIINKDGKPWVGVPNTAIGMTYNTLTALEHLICLQLAGTKTWERVWVDPALYNIVLPLNVRKQSAGLLNLARGTRLPVSGSGEVVRLFVYWQQAKQRTDIDLSCLKLDDNFNYKGQVSFNAYGSGNDIAHSGDIQSAPLGATEFIDLRLNPALQKSARYVFPSILRYNTGAEAFSDMAACHAGWMVRQDVDSNRLSFDPKTVAEKVDVKGEGKVWVPFLFDVQAREIVIVDLFSKGSRVVEGNKHFPQLAAAMHEYSKARPNYGALADWYILANGANSVTRDEATVTIGIDASCTINVLSLAGAGVTSLEPEVSALATA